MHRDKIDIVRTTINIDDGLLEDLKRRASETGSSVSQLIEDSVRLMQHGEVSTPETPGFELVTFGKGGQFTPFHVDKTTTLLELDDIERYRREEP